ncbi:MAG: sigma-70 family RNA polymerase sigma factor [Bacteroidetes bacterium]|nr:sigma-70 family RNA polymerase sigma factor [Bacteroidota bacterium]
MNTPSSGISLVDQLRNGDKQALEKLYDAYSGMVYGVILKMIRDEETAQEIVQDVFLKVWNNIKNYDESKARLSTWIMNIARNRTIDEIRSKKFRNQKENQNIEDSVYEVDKGNNTELKVDSIGLKSVIERLRPEQKMLLELVYFGGYTHDEAAKELSIPLGTVKTRLRASIIELRKVLKVE